MCVRNKWPTTEFHELKLAPGSYYRRMSRPSSSHPKESPGYNPDNVDNHNLIETSRGQLSALREQLERICRVVHPSEKTFRTFGHTSAIYSSSHAPRWRLIARVYSKRTAAERVAPKTTSSSHQQ